ncbi:dihydroorotase [candidate division WOR-1 bacterium RIFOXYB2_FULL_48_7]|uniref:Dihydroorotase n=1 Tax=candidate division WOR-1 bacterium RIFOXYB2_FULL_48_7 TaxID=1802583 RepID=A0A1F4TNM3_UNCSA|nr:MAG: dihydroorotase [candidate division WOR-1 bacterium RIFOXYB2_FULL_48_7]
MTKILIKNGRVIDPQAGIDGLRDILLENGKVSRLGGHLSSPGAKIIEAKGMLVMPGLIDMHVHLRDPGRPDKETIASGTRAAALGGFTSICCMANTSPVMDNPAVVEYVLAKARQEGVVNVYPIAAVTKGLKGEEFAEMGRCAREGAIAFSDDGRPVMSAAMMRKALEYAKQFDKPIISHCEDINLSAGGSMNEGRVSTEIGLPGIPALAEEVMVARDIMMAKEYGRVHIAHVSTAGSVKLIKQAKQAGADISCETCPHYFSLTDEAIRSYDTAAKVNPPLRTKSDQQAIIKALKIGIIDVIATDHAPHTEEDKNVEFNLAATGLVGLETALALVLTRLVAKKTLTLKQLVERMSSNPAKILRFSHKGTLKPGSDADVIIVDPKAEWVVDEKKFASKGRNTPFKGWKLTGKVVHTIVGGSIVVKDGKLT